MSLFKGEITQASAVDAGGGLPFNSGTLAQFALAHVAASGASIASTTLLASAPGPVSVEYLIHAHAAGASGTVNLTITYIDNDTGASSTFSTGALSLATANVVPLNGIGGGVFNCKPGSKISYSTSWSTAGTYDLTISVEAL